MAVYNKLKIALPVIVVLVLARCGSGGGEPGSTTAADAGNDGSTAAGSAQSDSSSGSSRASTAVAASEVDFTAEQIRAALKLLEEGQKASRDEFSASEIKAAMREHIERRTRLGKPGVFEITDPYTSQTLELQFQKIHDPVRVLPGNFYFACTNFGVVGEPDKTYDLDFWLQPHNGELKVYQENVHKVPTRKDNEWVQDPYYNFKEDRINLLPDESPEDAKGGNSAS